MSVKIAYGLAAVICVAAFPSAAKAADAYSTADLNVRAGPDTGFPIVTTIPDGSGVDLHGCVRGYEWCDVSWRGRRGWVYAEYLVYPYRDGRVPVIEYGGRIDLPVVTFVFGNYWHSHYRGEPWYDARERWRHRFAGESWWHDRTINRDARRRDGDDRRGPEYRRGTRDGAPDLDDRRGRRAGRDGDDDGMRRGEDRERDARSGRDHDEAGDRRRGARSERERYGDNGRRAQERDARGTRERSRREEAGRRGEAGETPDTDVNIGASTREGEGRGRRDRRGDASGAPRGGAPGQTGAEVTTGAGANAGARPDAGPSGQAGIRVDEPAGSNRNSDDRGAARDTGDSGPSGPHRGR
ncbi:SH3 domain-containing protein [Xanthobacteraceae bacterium Astr-EGSB]|uniref:SH3 domain-containing protein n=1 Tax=Astrobacterium formosum TaxID=3069710 RepID=UPI0027B64883|nr:SH3 domain-containing protein [Xanthobacteraceae bacterium Astr-EGSB]